MLTHFVARTSKHSLVLIANAAVGAATLWTVDAVALEPSGDTLINSAQNENQRSMAEAIANLCPQMRVLNLGGQLSSGEQQLFFRCREVLNATSTEAQPAGLQALTGEELNSAHSTTVDFGATQYTSVVSRLAMLRNARGGGTVASLGAPTGYFSFGGASGDQESGFAGGRLGAYLNARIGTGDKDTTDFEEGYDIDTTGLSAGVDYRFGDAFVGGVALSYGKSEADYNNGGNFDSDGYAGSLYGSWYGDHAYVDLIGSFGEMDHDSVRQVQYSIPYVVAPAPPTTQTIDYRATGSTESDLTSFGVSAGYRFGKGALAVGPIAAISYTKVETDGFTEQGANELNLVYGDVDGESLQLQIGFDMDYTFSQSWGVIAPHARVVYVSEQKNDQDSFFVRYALDPCFDTTRCTSTIGGTDPTQTTLDVTSDDPDTNFFRWGIGLSAFFANGVAAFVDYESIADLDGVSYGEATIGVRYEFR
jgi:outer membrane autotransporter protein